jgi:hypothetical protein
MKKKESEGFFCVVYFTLDKKTTFYNKTWNPSKLADYLSRNGKTWLWIKIYIRKQDYLSNPQLDGYYKIFDKDNIVSNFTFKQFTKKIPG